MIGGIIASIAQAAFSVFGKTLVDLKNTEAGRQANENNNGATVAGQWVNGHNGAGETRAGVQKAQGAWGPFGIVAFTIGMIISFYAAQIVLDSVAWHPQFAWHYYVIPGIEWVHHVPASWKVAALPPKWEDAVIEIVKSLFYVGPPATAAVLIAKVFRR